MNMNSRFLILSFFCLAITSSFAKDAGPEPLEVDSVKASAVHGDCIRLFRIRAVLDLDIGGTGGEEE